MWDNLSEQERCEYKKMILAFSSLTEMFAQKADDKEVLPSPIINSKYQETVFQKVFHAFAEDIKNTSYDASIVSIDNNTGRFLKYLIGIKTFGISAGAQKVAQFKSNYNDWANIINQMAANALDKNGKIKSKKEIDIINEALYRELALKIAYMRNLRIDSSQSNMQGFSVFENDNEIHSVYHILMSSKKGDKPCIYVGETSYDKIDTNEIRVLGCTTIKNPTNFEFTDGKHKYKYTSADSQLYMDFDNKHIIKDKWEVKYADNAYEIFSEIANKIYRNEETETLKVESYSWLITNSKDEVELFSGFNSFYSVGSKLDKKKRTGSIKRIYSKYFDIISEENLNLIIEYLTKFLTFKASTMSEKLQKVEMRKDLINYLEFIGNNELKEDVFKLLFRPKDEMYIPLPNSVNFHTSHPDFFNKGVGNLIKLADGKWKLSLPKELCKFTLVFEPSGDKLEAFITQDAGKAIESYERQSYLGEWILRKVFQLKEYEPLTSKRLKEVGINGIRLEKIEGSDEIHLYFIWIDKKNLPQDYIK